MQCAIFFIGDWGNALIFVARATFLWIDDIDLVWLALDVPWWALSVVYNLLLFTVYGVMYTCHTCVCACVRLSVCVCVCVYVHTCKSCKS